MNYLKLMGLLSLTLVPLTTETGATHWDAFIAGLTSTKNIIPGIAAGGVSAAISGNEYLQKKLSQTPLVAPLSKKISVRPELLLSWGGVTLIDQTAELLATKNIRNKIYVLVKDQKISLPSLYSSNLLDIPLVGRDVEKNDLYRLGRSIGTGALAAALQFAFGIGKRS